LQSVITTKQLLDPKNTLEIYIMSFTATRHPLSVRSRQTLSESLFEEGYEYVAGRLEDIVEIDPRRLSSEEIHELRNLSVLMNLSRPEYDKRKNRQELILCNKSKGARYIGRKLANNPALTVEQACSDWAALKDVTRWMEAQDKIWLKKMDLASIKSEQIDPGSWDRASYQEWVVDPGKLLHLGIRFAWQAERFCRLYSEVCNESRPWGSCYQPSHAKVKAIALTKNYNRLPLWVKKQMINSSVWVQTEGGRIGNVWRLLDCAKAWKWCPDLPKGISERIGKLSPKMRSLAPIAWGQGHYSQPDRKAMFWANLNELSKMSLRQIFSQDASWDAYQAQRIIEIHAGLPYKFLSTVAGLPAKGKIETTEILDWIAVYSSPSDACLHLFGCRGKATIEAFKSCQNRDAIRWAIALGIKNPDLLQKIFALTECVVYQNEAVEFLKQLKPETALRMIATTTFKVRGEDKPVEDFLVRDTGYLWAQIKTKPDLGRVRCWLSVHEDLAKIFVAEQPDEALPISAKWQPLQGLSAIDGSWAIELPTRTGTLKLWGEQLRNCVGGYGPRIKRGDCVVFGVRIKGIVRYVVEMVHGNCQQFKGDRNSEAPWAIKESVLSALRDAGV
jgi:hypothetical protein